MLNVNEKTEETNAAICRQLSTINRSCSCNVHSWRCNVNYVFILEIIKPINISESNYAH